MRKLLLLIALLPGMAIIGGAGVADAFDLLKGTEPKSGQAKPSQSKPKAPAATSNPCAQYGAGFVQVQGTQTCVRMNGSVRTDYSTSGRPR
jgi:hypothetical protein